MGFCFCTGIFNDRVFQICVCSVCLFFSFVTHNSLFLNVLLVAEIHESFVNAYTGTIVLAFSHSPTCKMSKEKTLTKNVSWLRLENAKLKTRLLTNQVRAKQLNVQVCVSSIFII